MSLNRIQKLLFSEYSQLEDQVLVESTFAETTRSGAGMRQVYLGLTPTKLIFAADIIRSAEEVNVSYCYGLDPSIENFELISVIPVECVNLSVFCRRKKRAIKAHFCNNVTRFFELGGFENRKVQWNLWCEQIKFLNPDHPGSSHSETSVDSFSSRSTLYVVSSNLVKRSQGHPQLWQHYGMGAGDSRQQIMRNHWGEKNLFLGHDCNERICQNRNLAVASTSELKMLYKNPSKRSNNKHSRKRNSSDNISLKAMVVNRFGSGVPENCLTGLLLKPKKSSLHLISCQQDLKLNNSSNFPMVFGFPMFFIEDNFPSCLYEQADQALHLWEDIRTNRRGKNRHPRRYGLAPQPFFLHGLGSWQTMPGDIYTTQIKQAVSVANLRMCPSEPEMCLQVSHRQLASSVSCEALHLTPHLRHKLQSRSTNKRLMQRRPVTLFWTPGYSYRPTNTRSAYRELRDHLKRVKLYQETDAKQQDCEHKEKMKRSKSQTNVMDLSEKDSMGAFAAYAIEEKELLDTNINGSYPHHRRQRDLTVIHLEKLLELDVKWTSWEFDSSTLANQITMIDCDLFLRIPQSEMRTVLVQKSSRNAPNLRALIAFSRRVCCLVATEILNEESHKVRARLISRYINAADKCNSVQNFQSCRSILAGLQSPSVYRLHHTWTLVRESHAMKYYIFEKLCRRYCDPRLPNYQRMFYKASRRSPYLPYIGDILGRLLDRVPLYPKSFLRSSSTNRIVKSGFKVPDQEQQLLPNPMKSNDSLATKARRPNMISCLLSLFHSKEHIETSSTSSSCSKNDKTLASLKNNNDHNNSEVCLSFEKLGDAESVQQKKGHLDNFLELCQLFQETPDVATKRLNEMTALLAKCQRAATKYALNQNNLAKEFLLKARYREESDNFIFSFKLEPMYSSLKMKMVNSKLQIKSSFYFDEHLF